MLESAGLPVHCEAPGVDERAVTLSDPVELARHLALAKARAVAERHPDAWVLGADQVAWDGSEVFGKPTDPEDHFARLAAMRGTTHDLVTGFALLGPELRHLEHVRTRLAVRGDLTDAELRAYVATGEGSGCAGGYAVEGRGVFLFEHIDGSWHNVLGLPLLRVLDVLRAHGWRFGEAA